MNTRIVKIYVVDDKGNGCAGQRVKLHGGSEQRTDRSGMALLTIESSRVTLYVNGKTAYDGQTARLNHQEVFTRVGRRA